jgi:hypothetical protein
MSARSRAFGLSSGLSPAEAEREAEQTRAELASIADALQRELALRHLVEKGLVMLKDYTNSHDALGRGLDAIRANPIPVALIGIGAAWLVTERIAHADRLEAARRRVTDLTSAAGARAGEFVADAAAKIGLGGDRDHSQDPMMSAADRDRAEGWTHQVVGMAQGALHSVRDSGEAMLDRAGGYAASGAGQATEQLRAVVRRHPLVTGAIGLAAGALVAALLPTSRTEGELMGSASEDLRRRVRETAARAVGAAADAAADTVRSEVDKPVGA